MSGGTGPLAGSRVLVVGATGGIGEAVCHAVARDGARGLALGVRDVERGRHLAERLELETGIRAVVVSCDLTAQGQPEAAVRDAVEQLDGLDGLVMCAGDPPWGGLWDVSEEDWERVLSTMLMGPVRAVRAAVPGMVERGSGSVVLVAGLNGRKPAPGGVIAGVVCAGLANFATAVARDVAASGVRVNVVDPHLTDTPRWRRQVARVQERQGVSEQDARASLLADVPRGRPVPSEDIAEVAVFLLSDRARSLTGAAVPVDGGVGGTIY